MKGDLRPIIAPQPSVPLAPGKAPTFSVIVAAYQAAAFIGDALESLLVQTRPPIEIIVCDDGSTDDLRGALEPYLDRIVVLQKENGGEASAKNMAARAASGEFIAILDADDVYYPHRLDALAELNMRRPDLDILTTDCVIVGSRSRWNCYHSGYRFEIDDQRRGILQRNFVGPGHMAVRREAFLALGGFDESFRWATDWDCWIRMIFAGYRAGMVDQPLAEYRIRDASLASNRLRMSEARVAVLEKAARRSDLSTEERAVLNRSLTEQRGHATVSAARAALVAAKPEGRRLALEVALQPEFPLGARLRSAVAAALPGLARRRLVAEARRRRELVDGFAAKEL